VLAVEQNVSSLWLCFKPGNILGRKPGVPNKLTTEVRRLIQDCFDKAGGLEALKRNKQTRGAS
jgi:hypothetical protein